MATLGSPGTLIVLDLGCNKPPPDTLSSGRIFRASPDGKQIETIVSGQRLPDAVAVLHDEKRLYWTAMGFPGAPDGTVWTSNFDGSDTRLLIGPDGGLNTPKQLRIDPVGRKLYVSDREGLKVVRYELDGSQMEILVSTGTPEDPSHKSDATRWCVGLAIDLTERKFYWTQRGPSKGAKGRIFRASMDTPEGSTPSTRQDVECIAQQLPEPVDLDIDPTGRYLYWTDRGDMPHGNSLNRCDMGLLSGKVPLICKILDPTPYTVLSRNLHEPVGLRVDPSNGCVWVADIGGTVYRFDLSTGVKTRMYEELEACYSGIELL